MKTQLWVQHQSVFATGSASRRLARKNLVHITLFCTYVIGVSLLAAQTPASTVGTTRPSIFIGAITGRIVPEGQSNVGIKNARVCLQGTAFCTTTSEIGIFRFSDVPWGVYELVGEAEGYRKEYIGWTMVCAPMDSGVQGEMRMFSKDQEPKSHNLRHEEFFNDKIVVNWQDSARSIDIPGHVVDVYGLGLKGANVCVKGSQICAMSSEDGKFVLPKVPWGRVEFTVQLAGYVLQDGQGVETCGVTKWASGHSLYMEGIGK